MRVESFILLVDRYEWIDWAPFKIDQVGSSLTIGPFEGIQLCVLKKHSKNRYFPNYLKYWVRP